MEARINYAKAAPGVIETMLTLSSYLRRSGLEESLVDLVCLRASQINGCAYCIDMHWKDLRNAGESEQRLYGLDAWDESPYYSDREQAALAGSDARGRGDQCVESAQHRGEDGAGRVPAQGARGQARRVAAPARRPPDC